MGTLTAHRSPLTHRLVPPASRPSAPYPWPAILVLAVLVLLPVGRSSEAPLAIGALIALALAVRGRIDWRDEGLRLGFALFACYWIPALISAAGAVAPSKTWMTIATTLRFLPFAWFAAWALRDARRWHGAMFAIAAVVGLWLLDAWVQMATGYGLAGAAEKERLSGIFGAGNLKLGPVLATLSPFVLFTARERFGRRGLIAAFLFVLVPVLLAGSRAAWLSYAVVCTVFAWRETRRVPHFLGALVGAGVCGVLVAALAWHDSGRFDARVGRSLLALQGTVSAVDDASAGRLSIWRTALAMSRAHPLTGVGVRGFRYAYPDYAAPGDRFVERDSDTGASHAHQIVLEVLSEAGIIGLAFWIVGAGFAVRAWRRADLAARTRAFAPGLALVAMCFPFNTHLAFYSAWWGLLFWWLLALYCAALGAGRNDGA